VLLPMGYRKVTALFFCSRSPGSRSELAQAIRNLDARGCLAALEPSGATTSACGNVRVRKDFSGLVGALLRVSWNCAEHTVCLSL